MTDSTLRKKVEELSARVAALEAENDRVKQENVWLQNENRLLRQTINCETHSRSSAASVCTGPGATALTRSL